MRVVEAQYEDGVLRPAERLGLRPGERVNLIVAAPGSQPLGFGEACEDRKWDDDLALAEHGLDEWAGELEAPERS